MNTVALSTLPSWRRAALAACAMMVALAGSAVAGTVEDRVAAINQGLAAINRGDYATALRLWRPLADEGVAAAQYNLGTMYRQGNGVPQDHAEVVKWYRLAADQGHAAAQYNLGFMYYNGRGVTQDYTQAVKWYRLAADQGVAAAQHNLGTMYGNGQGVPQDPMQAHKWYNLAAARYPAFEKEDRARAAYDRDNLASKMTPAQIAEAQKLAREWKPNGQTATSAAP